MRRALVLSLALCAPPALAWAPCSAPGISPPVPLQREAPAFPAAVREIGVEGTVELALTVLRDGTVGWVRVVSAEPRGYFEQAAVAGVRAWRFEPAREGRRPVECRMLTRVRFTLVDTVDSPDPVAGARPEPTYPAALLAERVEGYAEVEFEIRPDGGVAGARVVTAMPRGEFERAALAAIRRWRFDPAEARSRARRRFEFRLPDTSLAAVPATLLASAPFPMSACARGQKGRVSLEVRTDERGAVQAARILSSQPAGLFDATALTIARGSRLSPAYRDGRPAPATALITLDFDPARATCPGGLDPERDAPPARRPAPRVSGVDEGPRPRAEG